jgi:hypothetical protein
VTATAWSEPLPEKDTERNVSAHAGSPQQPIRRSGKNSSRLPKYIKKQNSDDSERQQVATSSSCPTRGNMFAPQASS